METTLRPKSIDTYWNMLKDLNDSMKVSLIIRLSSSLTIAGKNPITREHDLSGIEGGWASDSFPDAEELRQIRRSSHRIEEL